MATSKSENIFLIRGSAFINPMELVTDAEKELFAKGEENRVRRQAMSQDSLFNIPPSQEEQRIIHDFFIKTVDHKVNCEGEEWQTV
jgi:hypothetical protein